VRNPCERRYSVYILGSLSGTPYIGITSNLAFRVRQHKEHTFPGIAAKYDVDRLLYYETYGEVSATIAREKQLKAWKRSGRGRLP
jgi:putative endonuclease